MSYYETVQAIILRLGEGAYIFSEREYSFVNAVLVEKGNDGLFIRETHNSTIPVNSRGFIDYILGMDLRGVVLTGRLAHKPQYIPFESYTGMA